MNVNLNELLIPSAEGAPRSLENYSTTATASVKIEAVFNENVERRLVSLILENKDKAIYGCVAWLTSAKVLQALSWCKNVQIIVQKEDFLRPDMFHPVNWKTSLRDKYRRLEFNINRFNMAGTISDLSYCAAPGVEPVKCVGNHNKEKHPAFPRMHHKFLVFCNVKMDDPKEAGFVEKEPVILWTGSFNFTKNSTRSFENALILEDHSGTNPIINSYLKEHHQLLCLSESLDWESDWCAPDYRIGS